VILQLEFRVKVHIPQPQFRKCRITEVRSRNSSSPNCWNPQPHFHKC